MKCLNEKAEAIFRKLTEGLVKVGDHRKIDNAPGSFMAVSIEIIGRSGLGPLMSVAHYYEQNSDLMRDPDVVFLIGADQQRIRSVSAGQLGHPSGSGLRGRWRLEGPAEDASRPL